MDRDYNDFARLYRMHLGGALFIVRAKRNLAVRRLWSQRVDRTTGLRSDQIVTLADRRTVAKYPVRLRRVTFFNEETGRRLVFLTNDMTHPALLIAELYRQRWQIELFFKWVKQRLRIEHFMGNTINAIHTQLWIAISAYVLLAIIKHELRLPRSLYEIQQILSITLFDQVPLLAALTEMPSGSPEADIHNQLILFDF